MAQESDRPPFSADIPAEAVAAALEAVERKGGAEGDGDPDALRPGPRQPTATGPGVEGLRAELARAEARAAELSDQLDAEHDHLLRVAADLENQRKRAAREREEVQRYGNERLVKELLPVLDGLDRALAAAPADESLARGVEMVRRLFEDALARFGVKGFSSRGELFDPRRHEALMTVATAERPPGTILEEQQRGFFLHERLIRPAAVVVACAVPAAAPPEPVDPGEAPQGGAGGAPPAA